MAAPEIVLQKGQVLVSRTDFSTIGLVPRTDGYVLGVIEDVCDVCDFAIIGRILLFNPELAFGILSGATYYIIEESKILYQESEAL